MGFRVLAPAEHGWVDPRVAILEPSQHALGRYASLDRAAIGRRRPRRGYAGGRRRRGFRMPARMVAGWRVALCRRSIGLVEPVSPRRRRPGSAVSGRRGVRPSPVGVRRPRLRFRRRWQHRLRRQPPWILVTERAEPELEDVDAARCASRRDGARRSGGFRHHRRRHRRRPTPAHVPDTGQPPQRRMGHGAAVLCHRRSFGLHLSGSDHRVPVNRRPPGLRSVLRPSQRRICCA